MVRVIPFRKKANIAGWCSDDLSECYRVVGLLARNGMPVAIDSGLSDEGEPWAIILREDTGDVLLHLARLDGTFVVVSAAGSVAQRGQSLRAVLDTALRTGGLEILTRPSVAANSEILRLHPATLIAALIAAAWVNTQQSQTEFLEAIARREEGAASRTDEIRVVSAALPASAVLATAATSFAAVAAALHVTHSTMRSDSVLELTSEDFVQAALDLAAATPVIDTPGNAVPIELTNLELMQTGLMISSAELDDFVSTSFEAPLNNGHVYVRLDAWTLSVPSVSAGDISNFPLPQQSGTPSFGLSWNGADSDFLAIGQMDTLDLAPVGPVRSLVNIVAPVTEVSALAARPTTQTATLAQLAPISKSGEPTTSSTSSTFAEHASAPSKDADSAVKPMLPSTADKSDVHAGYSKEAVAFFFKSASEILRLDLDAIIIPAETASGSTFSKTAAGSSQTALSTTSVSTSFATDSATGMTSSMAKSGVTAVSSAATDVSLAKTISESDPSGVSKPSSVALQPTPLSNAQLILNFTNRTEDVLKVGPGGLNASLVSPLDTGNAQKVLVFDAPWLDVKSFMLMPGVIMVEDDQLGGVNRSGLELTGQHVTLDLGGGLTLTLLGVIDLGTV